MGRRLAVLLIPVVLVISALIAPLMFLLAVSGTSPQPERDKKCAQAVGAVLETGGPQRLPITGAYMVTSEFGMRFHPVLGYTRLHAGIDMAQTGGPGPIVAAKAGRVIETVPNAGGAGNFVKIDHGGGFATRYLHLTSYSVQVGEQVAAGQQIGIEGATGIGTGAHLHFETYKDGQPVNPRDWFASVGLSVPAKGGSSSAPGPGGSASAPTGEATAVNAVAGVPDRIGSWSKEQLAIAAVIVKVGQKRGLDERTQAIAVMVGMSESSLKNVGYGDAARADTVGVFQIGPEHGTYEQRMDPAWAAGDFYKRLTAVSGYAGLAPTIAAHRAQRNLDPYHYAPKWADAVRVVSVLTAKPELLSSISADGASAGACDDSAVLAAVATGPLGDCPPTGMPGETGLKPAALRTMRCAHKAFPQVRTIYGVGERGGPSDHGSGQAVDLMIEDYRSAAGKAVGDKAAAWAVAHAKELGISYVIWDARIWNVRRADEGWRPYTRYAGASDDNLLHKNHVHVSVTGTPASGQAA